MASSRTPKPKSRRITKVGALRIAKPDEWVRAVTDALKETDGYLDDAAEKLGVSRRTLQGWLATDARLAKARKLVAPPHVHRPK